MIRNNDERSSGFTIIELIVVIVIVAILAAITYTSYGNIKQRTYDNGVLSDLDTLDALETSYGLNNGSALAYYSNDGARIDGLDFSPSNNNVIDIVTDGDTYCIRGYNMHGSKNSIFNAFTKESNDGVCDSLNASDTAMSGYYSEAFPTGLWSQVDTNYHHVCALNLDGEAYCWGLNEVSQFGNGTTDNSTLPTAVDMAAALGGKTLNNITSGYGHTCAIASDDLAYCWGDGGVGELGTGNTAWHTTPVAVYTVGQLSGKTIKSITAGSFGTCAIASDDLAYCWGSNTDGQLGNNSTTNKLEPTSLYMAGYLSGKTIKDISLSEYHGCAIASDDLAYCWGYNSYGQLGNNSTANSNVPVPIYTAGILSGKTLKSIVANSYDDGYTCAIASDDLAYCWGYNSYGQLGNNSTANSSVPVAVTTSGVLSGKTIKSITAGSFGTCALASDNQLYCWGRNLYGELGNGSNINSLVPKFVYPY